VEIEVSRDTCREKQRSIVILTPDSNRHSFGLSANTLRLSFF
jgi:hypothetical protein